MQFDKEHRIFRLEEVDQAALPIGTMPEWPENQVTGLLEVVDARIEGILDRNGIFPAGGLRNYMLKQRQEFLSTLETIRRQLTEYQLGEIARLIIDQDRPESH